MELFFIPEITEETRSVDISGDEFHHLSKVLRIKYGDKIFLTNGKGIIASANISKISKSNCECEIESIKKYPARQIKIIALLPILKHPERFEFALEKLTELGVDEIQPYISVRTNKKNFRFDRASKILISSVKQSFNPFLPELKGTIQFIEFISALNEDDLILYGDTEGLKIFEVNDKFLNSDIKRIIITVGPEGAFTEDEIDLLRQKKAIPIWLGENRLRSETAIISLASQLKMFL